MIKRLYQITRANLNHFVRMRTEGVASGPPADEAPGMSYAEDEPVAAAGQPTDPLADLYANLEIPPGSNRAAVKQAWKRMMKKYHPDLHSTDPLKKETATELTRQLTEAYRRLDKELSNRG
ncbi:MAG: J domain-containing protein [Nitrospinaceae bacterium]